MHMSHADPQKPAHTSKPRAIEKKYFDKIKAGLREQRFVFVQIVTDSMTPAIKVGDSVMVLPVDDLESLKKYDILVFLSDQKLVCHYLVGISAFTDYDEMKMFLTRGLTSSGLDRPLRADHILGRATLKMSRWLRFREFFKR